MKKLACMFLMLIVVTFINSCGENKVMESTETPTNEFIGLPSVIDDSCFSQINIYNQVATEEVVAISLEYVFTAIDHYVAIEVHHEHSKQVVWRKFSKPVDTITIYRSELFDRDWVEFVKVYKYTCN